LESRQFEIDEKKIERDLAHSMGPSPHSPDVAPSDFWFFGWSKRKISGQAFSSREVVKTFLLEMWARMDSGQLFSVFDKWMKRLEYIIESGGEYYTQ
jgi:hypothetical protein